MKNTIRNLVVATGILVLSLHSANAQWVQVDSGLPANTSAMCLAVSGSNIFAGTWAAGVFLSTNNGTSWTAVNSGLTNTNVNVLAVGGSNIFAGTDGGGIFLSTNSGTSWTAVDSNLTYNPVCALALSGSNIFAVSYTHLTLPTTPYV